MLENKTYPLSGANRDAKSHNEQLQRFFFIDLLFLITTTKGFFSQTIQIAFRVR